MGVYNQGRPFQFPDLLTPYLQGRQSHLQRQGVEQQMRIREAKEKREAAKEAAAQKRMQALQSDFGDGQTLLGAAYAGNENALGRVASIDPKMARELGKAYHERQRAIATGEKTEAETEKQRTTNYVKRSLLTSKVKIEVFKQLLDDPTGYKQAYVSLMSQAKNEESPLDLQIGADGLLVSMPPPGTPQSEKFLQPENLHRQIAEQSEIIQALDDQVEEGELFQQAAVDAAAGTGLAGSRDFDLVASVFPDKAAKALQSLQKAKLERAKAGADKTTVQVGPGRQKPATKALMGDLQRGLQVYKRSERSAMDILETLDKNEWLLTHWGKGAEWIRRNAVNVFGEGTDMGRVDELADLRQDLQTAARDMFIKLLTAESGKQVTDQERKFLLRAYGDIDDMDQKTYRRAVQKTLQIMRRNQKDIKEILVLGFEVGGVEPGDDEAAFRTGLGLARRAKSKLARGWGEDPDRAKVEADLAELGYDDEKKQEILDMMGLDIEASDTEDDDFEVIYDLR